MEGAGEDPYLGSFIAKSRVKGFQGTGQGQLDAVMACAKHFAAYGAAIGGRDYNSADMSDRMLWETYLPPFKAAVDAGTATFMNSFNDLNGVPTTGNAYLQRDILKGKWKLPKCCCSLVNLRRSGLLSTKKSCRSITSNCNGWSSPVPSA